MTDEPILRRGDHGEWVSHLQRLLAKAGHDPGPDDGKLGDRTQASVWAYQRAFGLAVDGVIGPDTWFALHLPPSASGTATAKVTTAKIARPAGAGVTEDLWAEVVRQISLSALARRIYPLSRPTANGCRRPNLDGEAWRPGHRVSTADG